MHMTHANIVSNKMGDHLLIRIGQNFDKGNDSVDSKLYNSAIVCRKDLSLVADSQILAIGNPSNA